MFALYLLGGKTDLLMFNYRTVNLSRSDVTDLGGHATTEEIMALLRTFHTESARVPTSMRGNTLSLSLLI
jgi:hypothetical protein